MMLTLRYDPTRSPVRKPLTKDDFHPKYGDWDIDQGILALIKKELTDIHRTNKFKHVALSLSGGVDSRLTLAMIRRFLPTVKVTCICVDFGDKSDEMDKAREIARVYDCDFIDLRIDNVLNDLPKLIGIAREPRWNLYQYYAFQRGKQISDHFFTGDGGDELFGGYTFRYKKFLSLCPLHAGWKEKAKLYLSCHERDWVPDQDKMFGRSINFSWEKIYSVLRPYFQNNLDPLDQVFLADFNGKLLFDWLPTNQALGKYLGITIHSLFLKEQLIKFAFGVPWKKKYDVLKNVGKLPLRSLLNSQKGTYNDANDFIKKGFSVELEYLWNKSARDAAAKYLNSESEIIKHSIVNPEWLASNLRNLGDSSALNVRYVSKILSILALEVWYRIFVSKTMKSSEKI
jgi:asparagine synthase (glutamine-hydrolysing)